MVHPELRRVLRMDGVGEGAEDDPGAHVRQDAPRAARRRVDDEAEVPRQGVEEEAPRDRLLPLPERPVPEEREHHPLHVDEP